MKKPRQGLFYFPLRLCVTTSLQSVGYPGACLEMQWIYTAAAG
jgi:hypothetical protein